VNAERSPFEPGSDGRWVGTGGAALADVAPEAGIAKPEPVLTVDGLQRSFGGLLAVDVEHLEIQRGTITSLIGPNGAGKTTLFNLLTGFDRPDRGRWTLGGRSLVGIPAYRTARMGMIRTFQLTKVLPRMTVVENVMIGAKAHPGERLRGAFFGGWRKAEAEAEAKAEQLLERFGLTRMAHEYAGALSGGQRKLLEMARAMMGDPDVIMLDEPTAGVNPALTQALLEHVKALRDVDDRTVVFIEHDMDVVQEISDWVVVLAEGSVVTEGRPEVVTADQAVIDAYLGSPHEGPA
jgi:branched-chain amino acid transport system ATP-binding protein